jgi:hypothetical protein
MQISGSQQYPWMWPPQGGSATGAGSPTSTAPTTPGTGGSAAGAAAPDGSVQSFDAMLQSMILQLQSDANGTAGNAPSQTSTTSTTNANASTGQSATSTGQVEGHHHGHHRHHADGADTASQGLSATDSSTLQTDANNLASALFGALNSSTAAGTTTATDGSASTTASASTVATAGPTTASTTAATPGSAPWQTIDGTFAQDLMNAMRAYASQNNGTVLNATQTVSTVA